jgi:hypothetical protein
MQVRIDPHLPRHPFHRHHDPLTSGVTVLLAAERSTHRFAAAMPPIGLRRRITWRILTVAAAEGG